MIAELTNHLWQSTLFAAAVALLTLAFRKHPATVRYWLWFCASLKFLLPFSLLMDLGRHLHSVSAAKTIAVKMEAVSLTIAQMSQPFPGTSSSAPPARGDVHWAGIAAVVIWACGFGLIALMRLRGWFRIRAAVQSSKPLNLPIKLSGPVEVRSSPTLLEPGVVGLFRSIILLPTGIVERLTRQQLDALLAHELCHIKRRDNLTSACHMLVEAMFWFHPLVWWIGARLVEERERGCDEEVLRLGSEPQVYAETILRTCQFYVELPLACVSGVTGSNIKKRIVAIMATQVRRELIFGQKLLLAIAGTTAVTGPLLFGALNAFSGQAALEAPQQPATPLAFEVASVKPNKSQDWRRSSKRLQFTPGGGFIAVNLPLDGIIGIAYNVSGLTDRLSGGPDWIHAEKYDIDATAEQDAIPAGSSAKIRSEKMRLMLQALLVDRFKLAIRREMKERPVYALVVAKNGPKLQKANTDENSCALDSNNDTTSCHLIFGGEGRGLHGSAVDMSDLALSVSDWSDRPVIDRTGLRGLFNIQTEGWAPLRSRGPLPGEGPSAEESASADLSRPTLVMILQRLGLKLESQRAPVESFVIEHVERPTEN
jgi:bla regulator protein BlaR1